jgi:apolipoprotein N-acyltransferase
MPAPIVPDLPVALRFQAGSGLDWMQHFALWAGDLTGWRRHGLAFLLGVFAAAALPPVDMAPTLVVSFSGLIWLAEGCRRYREFFVLGWSFAFGFFLAGLYWIAISLFTDIAAFWWLVPFAVVALPAGLAIFGGLTLLAYRWIGARGIGRAFALALTWTVAEWLRGHVLSGFPWNLMGYAWAGGFPGATTVLQTASVTGIYGLSLLTVLVAALPSSLGEVSFGAKPWRRFLPAGAALAIIALLAGLGALRLAGDTRAAVPNVQLRLVQPSIVQSLKWDPAARESNFQRLLALSASPGADKITAIIWPEAAATYFLNRDPGHLAAIASLAPRGGVVLTGTLRTEPPPEQPVHIWNSLVAVDGGGAIVAGYDKVHLVPFGEYVPLRSILPLPKITAGSIDLTSGPGPRTLELPGLPSVAPSICYEDIFPEATLDPTRRPGWLLNVTNDAWFGFSSGPFQHFAMARVRSVEQGLPLVRSANNGISGVVDPYGRIVKRLALDDVGVLDTKLPAALPGNTLYGSIGDSVLLLLLVLCGMPLFRYSRSRQAN